MVEVKEDISSAEEQLMKQYTSKYTEMGVAWSTPFSFPASFDGSKNLFSLIAFEV